MKNGLLVATLALLVGCTSTENAPLIFGQAQTLGISVGASSTNLTPEITVGYKDINIAHIPTIVRTDDGSGVLIQGTVGDTGQHKDAYSTFGQFEASAKADEVSLGKFFATGIAARRLADGFACALSKGTETNCPKRPAVN